ncbi:MAG: D-arabinono-1,4-lactone oxidase [Pseudomonadota bacterium]|nr:D-arabinono-1,4-lactone oxidase [Pseudomonadota bacterium]
MTPEWRNWATNVRATPTGRMPATVRPLPARFRVAGVGGSSSRLVATDGVLLDGRALHGEPVLDPQRAEVRTPAGLTVGELGTWLAERGWSLPRVGTSAYPSVAGAIATASHGTGVGYGSLSDAGSVRGMAVVRPDGALVELDADRPGDAEDLAALRVHLGAFGVVTEVRLAVSCGAVVAVETVHAPLDAVLDPEVRAGADQTEAWWLPGSDAVVLTRRRFSAEPPDVRDHRALARHRLWAEDIPLHLVTTLARFAPRLAQALLARFGGGPLRPRRQVGRWDHLSVGPRRYRAVSTEVAVPIEAAGEALAAIRDLAHRTPLHVPINLRWSAADTGALLSPALGRDVFWVDVAWSPGIGGGDRVLREVERRLVALGGRPHWGKLGFQNPRALFPEFDRWDAVRRRYDPDGRLLNDHLCRLVEGRPLVEEAGEPGAL